MTKSGPKNKTLRGWTTRIFNGGTGSICQWHWGGGHLYAKDCIRKRIL